jgi:hypothetical protein
MSLGVVPIVSRAGAIEEAVRDGVDGWIVSQTGCVPEMIARIEQFLDDRPRLRAMSDAAVAAMRDRNWNESVLELAATLRRLLGERDRARGLRRPAAPTDRGEPGDADQPRINSTRGMNGEQTGADRLPALDQPATPDQSPPRVARSRNAKARARDVPGQLRSTSSITMLTPRE